MKQIIVSSENFEIAKLFKEECEKIGVVYNNNFSEFTKEQYYCYNKLIFSHEFNSKPIINNFALTYSTQVDYNLPYDWKEAIKGIKRWIRKENDFIELIKSELERAESKHPNWFEDVVYAVSIMNEEAGETIRAALQYKCEGGSLDAVKTELIHTAAMCIRCLKNLPQ